MKIYVDLFKNIIENLIIKNYNLDKERIFFIWDDVLYEIKIIDFKNKNEIFLNLEDIKNIIIKWV